MEKKYPTSNHLGKSLILWLATLIPLATFATGQKFTQTGIFENAGQVYKTDGSLAPEVKFIYRSGPATVYFTESGLSYVITTQAGPASEATGLAEDASDLLSVRFDLDFVGSKKGKLSAGKEAREFINYYRSKEADEIRVRKFEKVTYEDLYAGIDVAFYLDDQNRLKYDFIVHPGANPSEIAMNYSGPVSLLTDEKGNLQISTEAGTMTELAPYSFTASGDVVASSFKVEGNEVRFNIADYNKSQQLIIDPTLTWSTYYGGTGDDLALGMTTDATGNVYVTGYTTSTAFPVTAGAFQTSNNGLSDVFLTKFNGSGVRQWTTYYGGAGEDRGYDVAVDGSANVFVTGYTQSSNFPVTPGAFQTVQGGISDAFLLKFSSAGNRLYATFMGGASDDYGYGVVTDNSGNVFVAGNTQSNNFPVTAGAYQTVHGGGADAFLGKLSNTGTMNWLTYFGGSLGDEAYGITLDNAGNPVFTGRSFSSNYPVSAGAYQSVKAGGDDAVVTAFTTAGTLSWSTYMGGTLDDYGYDILTDATGNFYFAGFTASSNFPVTAGAHQTVYGGGLFDAYVSKLTSAGSPVWTTYLGGSANDQLYSITEDGFNQLYVTGYTTSTNFDVTPNAMQSTKQSGNDTYLTSFDPAGSLTYSSYFGGNNDEYGYEIEWNAGSGLLMMAGATISSNFPVTGGAFQTSNAGNLDAFISAFCNTITNNSIATAGNDSAEICVNGPYPLINGTLPAGTGPFTYQWQNSTNGSAWANITGANGQNYQVGSITTSQWFRRIVSNASCSDTSNWVYVKVNQPPVAGIAVSQGCVGSVTSFTNISTSASATDTVISSFWSFGDGNTSTTTDPGHIYTSTGSYTVTLVVTTVSGCTDTATISINLDTPPIPSFTAQSNCNNNTVTFTDNSTATSGFIGFWNWSFGDNTYSTQQNPTHTYASPGTYTVWLIATTGGGCSDTIIDSIQVGMPLTASFTSTSSCSGAATQFTSTSTGSASSWLWTFGDGDSSTVQNPAHTYNAPGTYTVTLIASSVGCSDTVSQQVTITPGPVAGFTSSGGCFGQSVTFTDTSFVSGGSVNSWQWNFGDGNTSTSQNPTHAYTSTGTYTVILVVGSASGCTDTATATVNVGVPPVAAFTAVGGCPGEGISFTDVSTGNIAGWNWNFGDGSTSTTQHPVHAYQSGGTYNATLIITTTDGCTDTITLPVTILDGPTADFSWTGACEGATVQFTDNSTSNLPITSWSWDFGNGSVSSVQNPTQVYTAAGTYLVQLVVSNTTGCFDTIQRTVIIESAPTAAFTSVNTCLGQPVMFTDASTTSTGSISSWSWNFGDGSTSNQQNPTHTYTTGTSFTVTLTVTIANGCSGTTTQNITLTPKPVAAFTVNDGCIDSDILFTDNSTPAGSITGWTWDLGAGQTSTQQNPNAMYASAGSYQVSLIVTTGTGCADTAVQTLTIHPNPVVDAGQDVNIFFGGSTQLSVTANPGGSPLWTPSAGLSADNVPNPIASPFNTTTYEVTVTSAHGCVGRDNVTVTVVRELEIPSAFTPNSDGSNDIWFLRNIGMYPGAVVEVYNRWGAQIYASVDYVSPWDGTYNGEMLPAGAYFYVVDLKDGSDPIKGTVTILK